MVHGFASRRARAVLVGSALFLTVAGFAFAGVRGYYISSLILPLLPAPATFACFEGTFAQGRVDIDDWSKSKKIPTGQMRPDGTEQYTIEFERTRDVPITRLALRLDYDDRKADYDWIYNFTLVGQMTGYGAMHARGECPWYEAGLDTPFGRLAGGSSRLGCGIDCDGGSMVVSRVAGTDTLALAFSEYGLSMKLGCGGGGRFRVRNNPRSQVFTLRPAPQSLCESFKRLD